jgi:hypothetical protein
MAVLEALPCFECGSLNQGTEKHGRAKSAAVIQCNEWANCFHSSEQIGKKPGNEKNQDSNLRHAKNSSTMYDDAWQIFCLTRNLQIQRKEIARSFTALRSTEASIHSLTNLKPHCSS